MPARKKYGTAPLNDIMEKDIDICIKKAKSRYAKDRFIYISELSGYFFADSSDLLLNKENIIKTLENTKYSGVKNARAKWK